ncbi:MAG: hypothetical protein AAGI37_16890 [Planctomycetota bacterium]
MAENMCDEKDQLEKHKKDAVDKYLDQVKLLTALATTLLLSPSVVLAIRKSEKEVSKLIFEDNPILGYLFLATNIFFVMCIFLTYFVYSSVVGAVDEGVYDVYRPATKYFSISQLICTFCGCITLLFFFFYLARV